MEKQVTGDYALLAVSALLFSLMFLFNGSYQKSRGTMIFSTAINILLREKPRARTVASAAVAAAATVCMMF